MSKPFVCHNTWDEKFHEAESIYGIAFGSLADPARPGFAGRGGRSPAFVLCCLPAA